MSAASPISAGSDGCCSAARRSYAIEHLRGKGGHIYYSDQLQVGHKIPHERLERRWAARRAYWDGVTDQKIRRLLGRPWPPLVSQKTVFPCRFWLSCHLSTCQTRSSSFAFSTILDCS